MTSGFSLRRSRSQCRGKLGFAGRDLRAQGEVIITIDGDYQNDPKYIPDLLSKLDQGYRVVSGRRTSRRAGLWTKRLPSRVANTLIRLISGVPVHDCGCGLKAYRRDVLEGKFVPKGFMNRFSPVSLGVKSGEFAEVEIVDRARIAGGSHYGLTRVFAVLRDLWGLPFAIRNAAAWGAVFALICATTLGGFVLLALRQRWVWSSAMLLGALFSLSNTVNLRRFVEAQRSPRIPHQSVSLMISNKLNVALIGAGYWGQKLLPKFSTGSDSAVMMVCDIHEGEIVPRSRASSAASARRVRSMMFSIIAPSMR